MQLKQYAARALSSRKRVQMWTSRADKPYTRAKLTVGDVAKETGVPKLKLSQYVNSREDNFCTWINKLRVGEASRLLRASDKQSVTEIAEATGFCDLPAFSRAFKKITGVSPRAFRNNK